MASPKGLVRLVPATWVFGKEGIVTHHGLCLQWEDLVNQKAMIDKYLGETLNWASRCLSQEKKLPRCKLSHEDGLSYNLICMMYYGISVIKDCPWWSVMHKDKEISERAFLIGWLWRYSCCMSMETIMSFTVSSQNKAMTSAHGEFQEKHTIKTRCWRCKYF